MSHEDEESKINNGSGNEDDPNMFLKNVYLQKSPYKINGK